MRLGSSGRRSSGRRHDCKALGACGGRRKQSGSTRQQAAACSRRGALARSWCSLPSLPPRWRVNCLVQGAQWVITTADGSSSVEPDGLLFLLKTCELLDPEYMGCSSAHRWGGAVAHSAFGGAAGWAAAAPTVGRDRPERGVQLCCEAGGFLGGSLHCPGIHNALPCPALFFCPAGPWRQ